MWLNNSAITKTKRVESMMSKLPHLIKKHLAFPPKSRPLSLPLVDRSTSLLTGLWATVQTLSRPFSMVSSACLAQTERRTPAPLCPGASLTPRLPQGGCQAASWVSRLLQASLSWAPPLTALLPLNLYYTVGWSWDTMLWLCGWELFSFPSPFP